jgi:hypothetical protein
MRSIIKITKAALRASLTGPGLLGWLIALIKPIVKVLNMVGDIDLLANYFGAAGRFLETGWGTLSSIVLGTVIIGYAIHRRIQLEPIVGDQANFRGVVGDHAGSATTESPPQRVGPPLQIEFGNDGKYERTEHIDETGIFRRMIYISVFNESLDDISDCNIRLIAATPRPKTGDNPTNLPVYFGANFDLRGTQRKFIQIVRFAENPGGNPSTLERDNIIISAASGGFFPGWTTLPIPSRDNPAILTLEAFAPGIASRTVHLHLWVTQRRIHAQTI